MSNHFNVLQESDGDEEIRDMKHLRNTKKKLGKKEQKMKISPSPELQVEIDKIRILIREFEDKDKTPTSHNKKKKKKEPKKDDDLDLDEINKFNKQRKKEVGEENERKKKEKRKRDEESAEYWKQYKEKFRKGENHSYRKQDNSQSEPEPEIIEEKNNIVRLLESLKLAKKELPNDIREIIDHFDKSKWKKLCMKYHPDKYKGEVNYGILLNGIKDYFEDNKWIPDETWTK